MKKILVLFAIIYCVSTALCACGKENGSTAHDENTVSARPADEADAPKMQSVLPGAELIDSAEEEPVLSEKKAKALEFVEKDVSELKQAIGEPLSEDYAPSCLGEGEDGELSYDGFTVITYKDGDSEKVLDIR